MHQASKRLSIVVQKNGKADIQKLASRQHDEVKSSLRFTDPEEIARQALRVITPNSLPQTPRRDHTKTAKRACCWKPYKRHISTTCSHAMLLDPQKLQAPPDTLLPRKSLDLIRLIHGSNPYPARGYPDTVRRWRPFARRLLITRRPPGVLILVRKPWAFLRWRRLGWKVRFILNLFKNSGEDQLV